MGRIVVFLLLGVAVYVALRGPRAIEQLRAWLLPALALLLSLAYVRSPIDAIPDIGPVGFVDDLLVVLGALWWGRRLRENARSRPRTEERPRREGRAEGGKWDPYAVLGVSPGASPEEITRAYREQMKRYHPDRVNGLGEELQHVAHEKTLEIQRAYRELAGGQSP